MKTPITQLIERLEAMQAAAPHIERNVYTKAIREAKEMLPIEINEIENAYIQGFAECDATGFMDVNKYILTTYPQPTKTDSADND